MRESAHTEIRQDTPRDGIHPSTDTAATETNESTVNDTVKAKEFQKEVSEGNDEPQDSTAQNGHRTDLVG